MNSPPRSPGHPRQHEHLVAFRNDVVHLDRGLVEASMEHLEQPAQPGLRRLQTGYQFVFDEPVGDDLINDGEVTGNEPQVEPAQ